MSAQRITRPFKDLDIDENFDFQRRSWRWQQVGQAAVGILVLAALAGLFGGGPLSRQERASASGTLRVEYPRWLRNHSAYELKIHVAPDAVTSGRVDLRISDSLLGALQIEAISPEPETMELGARGVLYRFRVAAAATPAPIIFRGTVDAIGSRRGQVGLAAGEQIQLRTFVYP